MSGIAADNVAEHRNTALPVLLFGLIVLMWGSTWLAIRLQLGSVPPAISVAYRFLLAAAFMFAWCALRRAPLRFPARAHARFALVGLLQYSTNYVLFYYSSGCMASGLVSILFALSVACNIVNGAVFLQRKVQPSIVVGALAAVLGLTLMFWKEITNAGDSGAIAIGILLGLAGTLSFSLGNIASLKNQQSGLPMAPTTAWSMLYGGLLTTIGGLVTRQEFTLEMSAQYLAGLVYLAMFGSAIAFVAYLTLLEWIGPDRAAFATVAFPIVSLSLSTVFEGYRWTVLAFLGFALILSANAAILVGRQLRGAAYTLIGGRSV